ncbi:MAG: hypothetical protein OEU93_13570 [Rubrivivax sp.]|nr:hypothetical protein [Rubrivivax sp.]MDH5338498.1 hypothetical protein [Rubrivivax sp.]
MRRLPVKSLLVLGALWSAAAVGAPVGSNGLNHEADPFELAERWTLASTAMLGPTTPVPPAHVSESPRLPLGVIDSKVPDPSAYALVGLGLLVAGLAAQRLAARRGRRGQRGFSKNT